MSWFGALGAIVRVTLVRVVRGRMLWIGGLIALLPVAFAAALRLAGGDRMDHAEETVFALLSLVLAVLPALFVASSVGEDIEDRAITYLWSRPVPRETVLVGKLVALAPVIMVLAVGSWVLADWAGARTGPPLVSILGVALGALASAAVAAGIGTLVPRHGMALTVCYLLFFDLLIGAMPISFASLSVSHHARAIAFAFTDQNPDGEVLRPAGWLAAIALAWLAIGWRRIRRLEA